MNTRKEDKRRKEGCFKTILIIFRGKKIREEKKGVLKTIKEGGYKQKITLSLKDNFI